MVGMKLAGLRSVIAVLMWSAASVMADIGEERVLILVNAASSSSQNAASKYRQSHKGIPDQNVVSLTGLPDVTSSDTEIITRQNFEACIAQPLRQYLVANNLVDSIWVIVTTPGMPYRIKDSTYADVVYPHGSNTNTVVNFTDRVDAASVESELAVLWQIDPGLDPNHRAPVAGRIVNPYHGYISPMSAFCADRAMLSRRQSFRFLAPPSDNSRVYEGQQFSSTRAMGGRQFCVKDMYLVARLDGPKAASTPPDLFVSRLIEMAARVSDPNNPNFHGFDPAWSLVVIDDKTSGTVADNDKWYSAGSAIGLSALPQQYLTAEAYPTPPNVASSGVYRDDYRYAFRSLVGNANLPDPNQGIVAALMGDDMILGPVVYDPTDVLLSQALDPNYGVVALCTFGIHQANVSPDYLLTGGPDGGVLFRPVYGAIFNSHESFSATTFFADANIPTLARQGKIWQWIQIQGSGALGHAFEPLSTGVADNDLLFFNYLRDADSDGVGDMTFVEAAYSAMPCLSWATVVVGDPLMRIHRNFNSGPGWYVQDKCGTGSSITLGLAVPYVLFLMGFVRRFRRSGL
jgi:hypothetical protein